MNHIKIIFYFIKIYYINLNKRNNILKQNVIDILNKEKILML